jgi:hypothetical protein
VSLKQFIEWNFDMPVIDMKRLLQAIGTSFVVSYVVFIMMTLLTLYLKFLMTELGAIGAIVSYVVFFVLVFISLCFAFYYGIRR